MTDTTLSVGEAYDRWSSIYDSYDNPMVLVASRVVADVAGEVRGKAVVEFGCGTGRNLAVLKAAGAARLAGLDLSDGMLAQARARDRGFELHRQDMAERTPFADASFDLALFCLTLEHVADMAPPLAEAARLIRPGGRICVVEIHPSLAASGVAAHFTEAGETVRMPTVSHRLEDYLGLFSSLGLTVARQRDWRPADLGPDLPPRLLKRGPETPYVVEFDLRPAGADAGS